MLFMARLSRVVLPGYPHHITQRYNRRQDVFFSDSDYEYYLELLKHWSKKFNVEVWAYFLMTNHIHLILCPHEKETMSRMLAEVHRRYTRMINFRNNWRGFLWQGRFFSYPLDKKHLLKVAAYVELNPVKAKMVENPQDYRWSSVHAHIKGFDDDGIIEAQKLLATCGDWRTYLES